MWHRTYVLKIIKEKLSSKRQLGGRPRLRRQIWYEKLEFADIQLKIATKYAEKFVWRYNTVTMTEKTKVREKMYFCWCEQSENNFSKVRLWTASYRNRNSIISFVVLQPLMKNQLKTKKRHQVLYIQVCYTNLTSSECVSSMMIIIPWAAGERGSQTFAEPGKDRTRYT